MTTPTTAEVIAWLEKEVERCIQQADGVPVHPAAGWLQVAASYIRERDEAMAALRAIVEWDDGLESASWGSWKVIDPARALLDRCKEDNDEKLR